MHPRLLLCSTVLLAGQLLANQTAGASPTLSYQSLSSSATHIESKHASSATDSAFTAQAASVNCGLRSRKAITPARVVRKSVIKNTVLSIITLGIYAILWAVDLKADLNRLGADIPSAWLMVIPILNIYFWYKFFEGYRWVMYGQTDLWVPLFGALVIKVSPYLVAPFIAAGFVLALAIDVSLAFLLLTAALVPWLMVVGEIVALATMQSGVNERLDQWPNYAAAAAVPNSSKSVGLMDSDC